VTVTLLGNSKANAAFIV